MVLVVVVVIVLVVVLMMVVLVVVVIGMVVSMTIMPMPLGFTGRDVRSAVTVRVLVRTSVVALRRRHMPRLAWRPLGRGRASAGVGVASV